VNIVKIEADLNYYKEKYEHAVRECEEARA
jgi:hypothetical protein